jgi:hypothetical protein
MVEATILVLRSDDLHDIEEFTTVNLPGVPRLGESVIAEGESFEVRAVSWSEELIRLRVISQQYGYRFPKR